MWFVLRCGCGREATVDNIDADRSECRYGDVAEHRAGSPRIACDHDRPIVSIGHELAESPDMSIHDFRRQAFADDTSNAGYTAHQNRHYTHNRRYKKR